MSTYHCCRVMLQQGQELKAKYCKQRWCAVCGSIRTANSINGYLPQFQRLSDIRFVTLTKVTVSGEDLPGSMRLMEETWRGIADKARKNRPGFKGVRKAECTIRPKGHYHYHFHILVNGSANAEWLVAEWLDRLGGLAGAKGQENLPADQRSYLELFKYATKLVASSKDEKREVVSSDRLDVIFRALRGKKTFYPFGGMRKVSEEVDGMITDEYDCLKDELQIWLWQECDWANKDGELLTGYNPSEPFRELFDSKILAERIPAL